MGYTSIRLRLVATLSVFLVAAMLAVWWLISVHFQKNFLNSIASQQASLVGVSAREIDVHLRLAQRALANAARIVDQDTLSDPDRAQAFLDNRVALRAVFPDSLFLLDAEGRMLAETSQRPPRRGFDISQRDYYVRTMTGRRSVISAPFLSSRPDHHPIIMLTQPIFRETAGPDGELAGILTGSIDLLSADGSLREIMSTPVGRTGYLYLFNRQRTMILHPDPNRILQQDIPPGVNLLLDKAVEGFEGTGETVNSHGRRFIATFKRLETTDWILASNFPVEEAYEPVREFRTYFFQVIAGLTALLCLLVWSIATRVTRSLERFSDYIRRLDPLQPEVAVYDYRGSDEVSVLARAFNTLMEHLGNSRRLLEKMSLTDHLTGLANRRCLEQEVPRLVALSERRAGRIMVVLLDIDHFKLFNDTFGHAAGDQALRHLADLLGSMVRPYDLLVRYGGEEFLLLMLVDREEGAMEIAERIRLRVENSPVRLDQAIAPLTVSAGVHVLRPDESLHEAINLADKAMYEAKAQGRNRVRTLDRPDREQVA